MIRFDIITIFPEMFKPVLNASILKRAREKNKVAINIHNLRDYTKNKHKIKKEEVDILIEAINKAKQIFQI